MGTPGSCPVSGCAVQLETVDSQWGEMPYCPAHRIRIHARTRTFVYHHGLDETSKRDAAMRNILFERDYFKQNILGNVAKAETHRICHETSEDALTWNVFSRLSRVGALAALTSSLTQSALRGDPELYLWGLQVQLDDSSAPRFFPPLTNARDKFEKRIAKFLTEPDIMLYVPGQFLILVEAKFTSGNTIAAASAIGDVPNEKPKSREGILSRYGPEALPLDAMAKPPTLGIFYSQLYRNLVFAIYMANELGVRWGLVSLVSDTQFHQRQHKVEFQDPTPFIHNLLPKSAHGQFVFYSWERLYADHVAKSTELGNLGTYLYNKSANGIRAFAI